MNPEPKAQTETSHQESRGITKKERADLSRPAAYLVRPSLADAEVLHDLTRAVMPEQIKANIEVYLQVRHDPGCGEAYLSFREREILCLRTNSSG